MAVVVTATHELHSVSRDLERHSPELGWQEVSVENDLRLLVAAVLVVSFALVLVGLRGWLHGGCTMRRRRSSVPLKPEEQILICMRERQADVRLTCQCQSRRGLTSLCEKIQTFQHDNKRKPVSQNAMDGPNESPSQTPGTRIFSMLTFQPNMLYHL